MPKLLREAGKDLVVPLHDPIRDMKGNVLHELYLKKGTRIMTSITAYNRHPDLWGSEPHIFRPERWLEMKEPEVKFGVYGNLYLRLVPCVNEIADDRFQRYVWCWNPCMYWMEVRVSEAFAIGCPC